MGGAALSIHQADGGHVHDIHYKNIRLEQAEQKLFDIKVLLCRYTEQMAKGEIHDIYFDNIQVLNGDIPVSFPDFWKRMQSPRRKVSMKSGKSIRADMTGMCGDRACTKSLPLRASRFPISRRGHPQFLLKTVAEIILIRITTLCADLF